MAFTSFPFLFLFLPFAIIVFSLAKNRFRPLVIVFLSLIFFLWRRPSSLEIIIALVLLNFILGRWIENWRSTGRGRLVLLAGILGNLGILVLFKSFTAYDRAGLVGFFSELLPLSVENRLIHWVFPIGLSYLTFQTISYLVDIYKGTCEAERNFLNFCLYIFFFPKLPSGPITRYRPFIIQLYNPSTTIQDVTNGLRRFAIGLGKKVLIADHLAKLVDAAFGLETPNFSPGVAWLVLFGYALQLYFDFSGYIDMALGLGQVFGFHLPENFNHPYISRSVGEFWRRWHITLSEWFREYVFYPLERRRLPILGQQVNIMIVFLLTGLWHGLTVNYVFWGLIHGFAIALESAFLGRLLKRTWQPIQHIYTLSVVLLGWIFFRSNSVGFAWLFLKRLFGDLSTITVLPFSTTTPLPFIESTFLLAFVAGLIFASPVSQGMENFRQYLVGRQPWLEWPSQITLDILTLFILWFSITALAGGSFTPGIYEKF